MTDPDDLLEKDKQKARKAYQQYKNDGNVLPRGPKVIEQAAFAIAITFVVFMVASMPFVGRGKLIPGGVWLGVSLSGMILFGMIGFLVRFIRWNFGDINRTLDDKFQRER